MSLLSGLQHYLTCTRVGLGSRRDNARAARLINDIVIGEETDVDPGRLVCPATSIFTSAPWRKVGARHSSIETFRSLRGSVLSIEAGMVRTGVHPPHMSDPCRHTIDAAQSGSTEEVISGIFLRPRGTHTEMFRQASEDGP